MLSTDFVLERQRFRIILACWRYYQLTHLRNLFEFGRTVLMISHGPLSFNDSRSGNCQRNSSLLAGDKVELTFENVFGLGRQKSQNNKLFKKICHAVILLTLSEQKPLSTLGHLLQTDVRLYGKQTII